jgi:two-component system, OmpR family, sensor histidine kinase ChvG
MSVDVHDGDVLEPARPKASPARKRILAVRMRRVSRAVTARFASSLTRRIIVLNLGGLVALLIGFLYLNQFRQGLIDARVQSLQTQSEIIAAAVAASATVDSDSITIDPEKLLQLAPGQSYDLNEDSEPSLEFSINPERVGPVLGRLVSPTHTRARVFDRDGSMLLDSSALARPNILRFDLPAAEGQKPAGNVVERLWDAVKSRFGSTKLPVYEDFGADNGKVFPEVESALQGVPQSVVRLDDKGETVVLVAAPIEKFRSVRGALLLSTQGDDIDKVIRSERWAIIRIFLVSAGVMFLISLFFAGTIAEPMRRLAEAAERVRRNIKSRHEIPDFSDRTDEIGHLSAALREMTGSLYQRIEAIESFAADVAHELKNPLTSLRSAVETLPIAKTDAARLRLHEVIKHDVRRLDRLISDISDASRLDAELARADAGPVDLVKLVEAVVSMARQMKREDGVVFSLDVAPSASGRGDSSDYIVMGHDSRLGQVVNNLVDNARSFSTHGGSVRLALRPARNIGRRSHPEDGVEIVVDDDGPGVPSHALEKIFERFYTDRPNQGFGQNSGLGLSISRQIVEAHGGRIWAVNRYEALEAIGENAVFVDAIDFPGGSCEERKVAGARFVLWLPFGR